MSCKTATKQPVCTAAGYESASVERYADGRVGVTTTTVKLVPKPPKKFAFQIESPLPAKSQVGADSFVRIQPEKTRLTLTSYPAVIEGKKGETNAIEAAKALRERGFAFTDEETVKAALPKPAKSSGKPMTRGQVERGAALLGLSKAKPAEVQRNMVLLQKELTRLGYCLGTTGADGRHGQYTQAALDQAMIDHPEIRSVSPAQLVSALAAIQS